MPYLLVINSRLTSALSLTVFEIRPLIA